MNFPSLLGLNLKWSSRRLIFQCSQFSTSKVLGREVFNRDKANVNLVTLGASQHGKTALASRLTKVLACHGVPAKEICDIDHSVSERENGRSENVTHMELWRGDSQIRYSLADLPGSLAYVKNTLNHLPHADVALLVISPEEGLVPDAKRMYYLSRHMELPLILPIISMREDTDEETVELVQMELQELEGIRNPFVLSHPMNNDNSMIDLLGEIEKEIHSLNILKREVNKPFYMVLEQVGSIPSRGDFCAGRVLQGKLAVGDQIEAFYKGKTSNAKVKDMEIYQKVTSSLEAGDRGGAFVKLKLDMPFKRGGVLFDPKNKVTASDSWEISLKGIPGLGGQLNRECVMFSSTMTDGRVSLAETVELKEDEETVVKVKMSSKIIAKPGDKVVLRNSSDFAMGTIVS